MPGKFAVPRNRIGGDLGALDQRADHVGFGDERIDHEPGVVRIDGADEAPIAGPGVHLDLDEAGADAFVRRRRARRRRRRGPVCRMMPLLALASAAKVVPLLRIFRR